LDPILCPARRYSAAVVLGPLLLVACSAGPTGDDPGPDSAVDPVHDTSWPDPQDPDDWGTALALVIEGELVPSGGSWAFDAPPAGLEEGIVVSLALSVQGDEPVTLSGAWTDDPGWSWTSVLPDSVAPGESATLSGLWTAVALTEGGQVTVPLTVPGTDYAVSLVATVPDPLRLVVVGTEGLVITSTDGTTWTVREQPTTSDTARHRVTWGDGRFLRSWSSSSEWDSYGRFAWSADGVTWTDASTADNFWPSDCAHGLGQFLCVWSDAIAWSSSGEVLVHEATNWDSLLNAVVLHQDRFVAVGRDGRATWSTDGTTWAGEAPRLADDDLNAVASGHGVLVAVGGADRYWLATSQDGGETWAGQDFGAESYARLGSVAFAEGLWLAAGYRADDTLLRSGDGVAWEVLDTDTWQTWHLLGAASGWFYAADNPYQEAATLYRTRDGESWESLVTLPDTRHAEQLAVQGWEAP